MDQRMGKWFIIVALRLMFIALPLSTCKMPSSSPDENRQASPQAKEPDSQKTRPDTAGGAEPDWFKSGLYFIGDAVATTQQQSKALKLEDLPETHCFFNHGTQAVGEKGTGLSWSFENSATEATLQITLWTDQLPESGSSFQFSSATPLTERSIAYGDKNGSGYVSAEGSALCTLNITYRKILDQQISTQTSGPVPSTFHLAGNLDCLLANHTGDTLRFKANVGCDNGSIVLPASGGPA